MYRARGEAVGAGPPHPTTLHAGAYGTVFRGERLEDGAPVAVKVVPKARLTDAALLGRGGR